uniref:Stabilizer of axonemal microtubules 2 n=1 Tax=Laticauda laticaudata TaxID=8630 RepID=A0A8C5RKJ6_LATLA
MKQPRCLCQICTCGRHRCPHNPTRIYDYGRESSLMTEYTEKYPLYHNVPPPKSLRPKQEYRSHGGKMEGLTTFRSDYLPYDITYRPVRAQEEYKPMAGEIDMATTYRRDYNPHKIEPIIFVRPSEKKYASKCKLSTIPTYQADFKPWEIEKREPCRVEHIYHLPTEKFGNTTTSQDAFIPREFALRKLIKPADATTLSDQPFISDTCHRSDYVTHQLEPKWKKSREAYRPSSQPFENVTTHQSDFRGLPGDFPKSFKPEPTKIENKSDFEGMSEFRDRFQPWAVSLPELHKAKEYAPPTGSMEFNSTSRLDYPPHIVSPVVLMKPLEKIKKSSPPFQGNTTMRDSFQAWDIHPPEMIKRTQEIPKPSGKFNDTTTFQSHYTPHSLIPTQSCKPTKVILSSSARFEDETIYHTDYTPKRKEICPVNYPSPPGYVYVSTDSRGHKFFRKVTPDVSKVLPPNGNHVPKEIAVVS